MTLDINSIQVWHLIFGPEQYKGLGLINFVDSCFPLSNLHIQHCNHLQSQ